MRKTLNREIICGRVYEHTLTKKVTGPESKNPGTEYIGGELSIATDADNLNVVTVHFTYVTATTKKGQTNSTYTALAKIIDEGKTVIIDGSDEATLVKVSTSLGLNEFPSNRNGQEEMVCAKRNEGGFVTILSSLAKENDRNKFEFDMLINGTRRVEADEERNIPEDYVIVKGAIFDFRNAMLPVELVCRNSDGMNYFERLDASASNLVFTKVWGEISSQTIITKREEASAFGEPAVREYSRTIKEWTITGCNPEPYELGDETNGITADEIKQCMADREVHLAEVKKRAEEWQSQRAAANTAAPTNQATAPAAVGGFNF